jgi:hypothetical protein
MEDLVPSPVSRLSLLSHGTGVHRNVLDVMFRHFFDGEDARSVLPALGHIEINVHGEEAEPSEAQRARLQTGPETLDVVLCVTPWDKANMQRGEDEEKE